MNKLIIGILIGMGLAIAARVAIGLMSSSSAAGGMLSTSEKPALADCPDTPNCQGSMSSRASQQVQAFQIAGDPERAMATIAAVVQDMRGARVEVQSDTYLHATVRTRVMGFIDDVEFLLDSEARLLHVRSASRLGLSDLGANAARVEQLRQRLAGKL